MLCQFRICATHFFDQIINQLKEEWLRLTQLVTMTQCTACDTAQHISTAFVTRNHAVNDQERSATDMIRNHAQRFIFQIRAAGFACSRFNQRLESINFIVRVDVLQYRRQTFHTHAGINARFWQRMQNAVLVFVELHEHQIPDFDETVTVFLIRSRRAAPDIRAVVVENFSTRTARAGICHLPEIVGCVAGTFVVADTDDTFCRYADLIFPDIVGFIIFVIHRHGQLFCRQFVDGCQQFPCVADCLFFEVITEREVTQHFEEGMVTCGIADVFQIVVLTARTHTALRCGGTCVRALILTKEYIFELHHTGVGEQQGWIIGRYQAGRANTGVSFGFEKTEEFLADFGRFHR